MSLVLGTKWAVRDFLSVLRLCTFWRSNFFFSSQSMHTHINRVMNVVVDALRTFFCMWTWLVLQLSSARLPSKLFCLCDMLQTSSLLRHDTSTLWQFAIEIFFSACCFSLLASINCSLSSHHSNDESILWSRSKAEQRERIRKKTKGNESFHVHYIHLMLAACKCFIHSTSNTKKKSMKECAAYSEWFFFINRFVDVNTSQGRIGDAGRILSKDPRVGQDDDDDEERKKSYHHVVYVPNNFISLPPFSYFY